jgi:hypothetical protein
MSQFATFLEQQVELNENSDHPVFKKGDSTLSHVKMALHRGGFDDHKEITGATYSHMHKDMEVHKIKYPSPEHDGEEEGHVYIDKHGHADY